MVFIIRFSCLQRRSYPLYDSIEILSKRHLLVRKYQTDANMPFRCANLARDGAILDCICGPMVES